MKYLKFLALSLTVALLVACGGGGSGPTSPSESSSSTLSLPFATAMVAYKQVASHYTFTITGSCSGTGSADTGAPYASNLYGAVYGRTQIHTVNYTNCTGSGSATFNAYMDNLYNTIAIVASDSSFIQTTVINNSPTAVRAGDTMTLMNIRVYSNSTKQTQINTGVQSLLVEADSNQSLLITFITQIYNSSNQLAETDQSKFRLFSDGKFQPLSFNAVVPSGRTEVWTYN